MVYDFFPEKKTCKAGFRTSPVPRRNPAEASLLQVVCLFCKCQGLAGRRFSDRLFYTKAMRLFDSLEAVIQTVGVIFLGCILLKK